MKNLQDYFIGILFILLIQSCASVTQYQTAIPAGEGNAIFRLSMNGNLAKSNEDGSIDDVDLVISSPVDPEFGINYGITNKIDFIAKINAFGSFSVGGKYTIAGNQSSKAAIAIGPTMNYFWRIINFTIPLHLTLTPNELFSFTITPSYTTQGINKLNENINDYYLDINKGYFSLSPYFEVGKKVKFMFGCNFSFLNSNITSSQSGSSVKEPYVVTQYGLGIMIPTSSFKKK